VGVLISYLKEEMIKLNVSCQNWEEAVREAGELLYKNGIVESRYIENMIEYVKKFGPYIVLLPGFALAHARPEDGAIKIGMSMITLKEPIDFGHEDNDPVSVVVGLASTASENHVQFLADICEILKDEENIERVKKCISSKDVIAIFTGDHYKR
jgi:mannitol/fructose-specific phosphotransferase system IIA component (Ntr-type)